MRGSQEKFQRSLDGSMSIDRFPPVNQYDEFIASKVKTAKPCGFTPHGLNPNLFEWQSLIVNWACSQGRAALFEECGLGKTLQQLEWARQVVLHTGQPVLILCPLAVASQTVEEGRKFGIDVKHVHENGEVHRGVNITNYERIDRFECSQFVGVVLDESSILKSLYGVTRNKLTALFAKPCSSLL